MKTILLCCLLCVNVLFAAAVVNAQKAGEGVYDPKLLKPTGTTDTEVFKRGKHYLRIDASSWFANNQSNFLKDKLVSGTVNIDAGSGTVYQFVLGQYPLSGQNRIAPVFNQPLVLNHVYKDEGLNVTVFIKGIKKNTIVGDLLTSLASSTLDLASGALGTVTMFGPAAPLSKASKTLFDAAQSALNKGEDQYGIFEKEGGLKFGMSKDLLAGPELFYLAYRGNKLPGDNIKVVLTDGVYNVTMNNQPLVQGV